MTKFGLKLWSSNTTLLVEAQRIYRYKKIDFIEIFYNPMKSVKGLKKLKDIPIILHAPTEHFGLNLMRHSPNNYKLLNQTLKLAEQLDAKSIIVHPGIGTNFSNLQKNLQLYIHKSLIFENMPMSPLPNLKGDTCYGYSSDQMNKILALGFEFCLDINHAIKAASAQDLPYKEYICQLMLLRPKYFHLSDGNITKHYDEHLNLGEGEYDLKWIKKILTRVENPYIVFETPKEGNSLDNDLRNIEYFKSL